MRASQDDGGTDADGDDDDRFSIVSVDGTAKQAMEEAKTMEYDWRSCGPRLPVRVAVGVGVRVAVGLRVGLGVRVAVGVVLRVAFNTYPSCSLSLPYTPRAAPSPASGTFSTTPPAPGWPLSSG